jgi:hypothetical protein
MVSKTVTKPVFQAAAPAEVDDDDLIKLAYLADPSKAPYIECREEGHHWKRQHKGWIRNRSTEPFQKTYRCVNGCQGVKIVKQIEGEYRNFYYIDSAYYIEGARLLRREIRDYEIDLALAEAKAAEQKQRRTTATQRAAGRTTKPSTVTKGRKR